MTIQNDDKGTKTDETVTQKVDGTDVNQKSSSGGSSEAGSNQNTDGKDKKEDAGQPKKKSDALNRAFSKIAEGDKELKTLKETYETRFKTQEDQLAEQKVLIEKLIKASEGIFDLSEDNKKTDEQPDMQALIDAAVAKALEGKTGEDSKKSEDPKGDNKKDESLDEILLDVSNEQLNALKEIEDTIGIDDALLLKHLKSNRGDISKAIEEFTKEQKQMHEASVKAAENPEGSNKDTIDALKKVLTSKEEIRKIPTANGVLSALKSMIS